MNCDFRSGSEPVVTGILLVGNVLFREKPELEVTGILQRLCLPEA